VVNNRVSLIFIPVSKRSLFQLVHYAVGGRVKLCGHPSKSNHAPCCLTWRPFCQAVLFLFCILFSVSSWDFRVVYGTPINISVTCSFTTSALKMETQVISATLVFSSILTRLIARENFSVYIHFQSLKSYMNGRMITR
jgi:hypothetical protein